MNPFGYQGPVPPARLIDRRAELGALQAAAANRGAVRVVAPRRYGKTTLLDAHVAMMREEGHRAVRLDLSKVGTVADIAARVAAAYAALPADSGRTVRRWAARLGVRLGVPGARLEIAPASHRAAPDEARSALLDLLDLPQALHDDDGGLTVVCFDEFQDLLVADQALDGLVRSVIQHHGGAAAYVYAASEPSLMRALFSERERPFYGQARPLALPPLPPDEAGNDIEALLAGAGLDPSDAVDRILDFTAGHPQRTMLLAHHLFEVLSEEGGDEDPAETALARALAETRDAHEATWDALGRPERIVLLALADGRAPTGSSLAEEHRISRSTLQTALERLPAAAEPPVPPRDGAAMLDPLFGEWLRRR